MEQLSESTSILQTSETMKSADQQIGSKVATATDHDEIAVKQRKLLDDDMMCQSDKQCRKEKTIDAIMTISDDKSMNLHNENMSNTIIAVPDDISMTLKHESLHSCFNNDKIKINDAQMKMARTAGIVDVSTGEEKLHLEPETQHGKMINSIISFNDEQRQEERKECNGSTITNVAFDDSEKCLDITLIPEKRDLLSDYNMMLVENIEFFQVPSELNTKMGLRCIRCTSLVRPVTAATFFPSSVSTISSGIGTIGARHFAGGKCPNLPSDMIDMFKERKKSSQQQTRMPGRIGLDAYCRTLAKRENIQDVAFGGIQVNTTAKGLSQLLSQNSPIKSKLMSKSQNDRPCANKRQELKIDTNDPTAFVEGAVEHFWECKHCNSLPYYWRASGSVVFSASPPSLDLVRKHLSACKGKIPLRIPRNATIERRNKSESEKENENATSIVIRWQSLDKITRKSDRIQKRLLSAESSKKRRSISQTRPADANVNEDVEDVVLVHPEDKTLTTDFAYFTVQQLKKCYLTKSGGSRGNCPLGYPGLACTHCIGTSTARRFFYTSADHLRNSFSHIPSHLATCTKCPKDVKEQMEEFKEIRSKQKSQLNTGDHKQFIDRLWFKLHGPDGGIIDTLPEETLTSTYSVSDDDSSVSSISLDERPYTTSKKWLGSDHIAIERAKSDLVSPEDRKDITDYMFYSFLQMVPKLLDNVEDDGDVDSSESERHIPSSAKQTIDSTGIIRNKTDIQVTINQEANPMENQHGIISKNEANEGFLETTTVNVNMQKEQEATETKEKKNYVSNETVLQHFKKEIGGNSYTIVCKHCNNSCWEEVEPKSGDDLRNVFPEIPKHLLRCSKCPTNVKEKLTTFKSLRALQEAFLRRGAQKKFTNIVWNRLEKHFTEPKVHSEQLSGPKDVLIDFKPSYITPSTLVTENDRHLVTQFTFFTMQQMKTCYLERSGNGARSMFQYGFPGLSCLHCADTPSARKFFYRTPDILSGNYAHIPNHVLTCKHCPAHVKRSLAEMKKVHATEKLRLHRGSQRIFFNNIWERLHRRQT